MLAALKIGDVIAGKYRIEGALGDGAMGEVFRGHQIGLERPVAVKVLHAHYAHREDARARFVREARVAGQLHHPNSVTIFDFGEHGGELYLVMELLVGESLRERLHRPLAVNEALSFTREVASALAAAHLIGLVHRDIKPENIFIVEDDGVSRARVVDFGLAFIAANDGRNADVVGRLTEAGILGGTPAYMSPEQIRGYGIGPASDIYSLGGTLYEMLAGRQPFLGSLGELLTKNAYATASPLRQLTPAVAVPPEIDELIERMMAKSAPMRPPADDVIIALDAMLADVGSGLNNAPQGRTKRVSRSPSVNRVAADSPNGTVVAALADATPTVDLPISGTQITADLRTPRRSKPQSTGPLDVPAAPIRLRVYGEVEDEVEFGLVTNGFTVALDGEPKSGDVIYAPNADPAVIGPLCARGVRVVTDVDPRDLVAVTKWIRLGVDEIVARPIRSDDLARKLRRAMRKRRASSDKKDKTLSSQT